MLTCCWCTGCSLSHNRTPIHRFGKNNKEYFFSNAVWCICIWIWIIFISLTLVFINETACEKGSCNWNILPLSIHLSLISELYNYYWTCWMILILIRVCFNWYLSFVWTLPYANNPKCTRTRAWSSHWPFLDNHLT